MRIRKNCAVGGGVLFVIVLAAGPALAASELVAVNDAKQTPINEGLEIDVLANDVLPDGAESFDVDLFIDVDPQHGTAQVFDSQDIDRRAVLYQPDPGYDGSDSFEYEACITFGDVVHCDVATVAIRIHGSDMPTSTTTAAPSTTVVTIAGAATTVPPIGTSVSPTAANASTAGPGATALAAELPRTGGGDATGVLVAIGALAIGAAATAYARPRRR